MSEGDTTKRVQIKNYHLAENADGEYCGLYLGNLKINESPPLAGMPDISEDITYALIFSQLVNERILPSETGAKWGFAFDKRRFLVSGEGDQKWIMFNGYLAPRHGKAEKRKPLPRPKQFWEFWRKDQDLQP